MMTRADAQRLTDGADWSKCRLEPGEFGNSYWFRKGQEDARDRWFVLGVVGGWISAALFAGAFYWLGAL